MVINLWGYPFIAGWFLGSLMQMDDMGYPHLWKHPSSFFEPSDNICFHMFSSAWKSPDMLVTSSWPEILIDFGWIVSSKSSTNNLPDKDKDAKYMCFSFSLFVHASCYSRLLQRGCADLSYSAIPEVTVRLTMSFRPDFGKSSDPKKQQQQQRVSTSLDGGSYSTMKDGMVW